MGMERRTRALRCVCFQYKATDFVVEKNGKFEVIFTPSDGSTPFRHEVHQFNKGGGVCLGMYNTDEVSILEPSAHLQHSQCPLWLL